jgi:hypothetical protein
MKERNRARVADCENHLSDFKEHAEYMEETLTQNKAAPRSMIERHKENMLIKDPVISKRFFEHYQQYPCAMKNQGLIKIAANRAARLQEYQAEAGDVRTQALQCEEDQRKLP